MAKMDLSKYNAQYLAYCAGLNIEWSGDKNVPPDIAIEEFNQRIAAAEPETIKLASLKTAPDYTVLESFQEQYYDGPDGPYMRTIVSSAFAFGREWARHSYWVDKARDCRETWYEPV